MDKTRLLIIGLTSHHTEHIQALQANPTVLVAGVCDINVSQAKEMSSEFNDAPYFTNVQAAIESLKPDAVFICLPHDQHLEVVELALKNGIHIFKEKPFAHDLEEANKIANLFKQSHSKIMTVSQRRFHKTYLEAKNHIGEIGQIKYVLATYSFNKPTSGWRKNKKASGGGVIIDSGYHLIDLLLYYFGLPETVKCELSKLSNDLSCETEDYALIELDYADGNNVQLILNRLAETKKEEIIIYGELGKLFVTKNELLLETYSSGTTKKVAFDPDGFIGAYQRQHKEFFSSLSNGHFLVPGVKEGVTNSLVIEACYLSADTNSTINTEELMASRRLHL